MQFFDLIRKQIVFNDAMMRHKIIAWVLFITPATISATPSDTKLMNNTAFEDAFEAYYGALVDYTQDDLMIELSETIEDVLISGSHMSQTSLSYKVRQINNSLLDQLHVELCTASTPPSTKIDSLKRLAAKSVSNTSKQLAIIFAPEELGMITGVAVRLAQVTPRTELCRTK